MNNTHDPKKTITIQRSFDASIDLVWEAWTRPEHIPHWWGPHGLDVKVISHDFKIGGRWKYTMVMQDGREFITEGEFSEIVPQAKIVTSADFRPMTEGVILEILFKSDGQKTHFTFHVIHPTEEYKLQQERMGVYNGWGSVFDRLGEFLNAQVNNKLSTNQFKL